MSELVTHPLSKSTHDAPAFFAAAPTAMPHGPAPMTMSWNRSFMRADYPLGLSGSSPSPSPLLAQSLQ